MKPTIAVVTNVDREHLEYYAGLGEIQDAFVAFLSRLPFYGAAVVCLDDPNVRNLLPRVDRKVITYGLSSEADISATDIAVAGFEVTYAARRHGTRLGTVRLRVPVRHSVYNSLAAIAVGLELDVPFRDAARALARFRGADRRFQKKGTVGGAMVIDDYGHHPTEIVATLQAVREGLGARTVVVFQPHRYSRTKALLEEFGRAFFLADRVIVTNVYAAGEAALPGVDGSIVADALVRHGHPSVVYEPRLEEIPKLVKSTVRPGDIALTLGAGSGVQGRGSPGEGARRRPGLRKARAS
jgi:UDP-N-acetylmuramate--alanine ligase